jgi:CTP synthase (UTP-ammonia lyase)
MARPTRIAVVGDFDPERPHHRTTNEALEHAGGVLGVRVCAEWIPTASLEGQPAGATFAGYDAIFAAPGSYASKTGALEAIRFARERGWPFFGT